MPFLFLLLVFGLVAAWFLMRPRPRSNDTPTRPWGYKGTPVAPTPDPPALSPMIDEDTTVALRRQIPVDHDDPATSWLGDRPRMPTHVRWPTNPQPRDRTRGEVPLHFMAQIDCSKLPADLWGGLGPRKGWLLLFLDAQENGLQMFDGDHRPIQVIHVDELGPERAPPENLRPVKAGHYGFRYYRSEAEIPNTWRKWPVDIVTFPNILKPDLEGETDHNEITVPVTRMTSETLYPDAQINRGHLAHTIKAGIEDQANWPFTWRGALYVVDAAIRDVAQRRDKAKAPAHKEYQGDRDWFDNLKPTLAQQLDQLVASYEDMSSDATGTEPNIQTLEKQIAAMKETIAFIHTFENVEQFNRALQAENAKAGRWLASLPTFLEGVRADILTHDLDSAMPLEAFAPILKDLMDRKLSYWQNWPLNPGSDILIPRKLTSKLDRDNMRDGFAPAQLSAGADLYTKSKDAAALIPPALLPRLEAKWRHLNDERPHRMGGYPDPVQGSAGTYPRDEVLLFQLASDDAMEWCWGDLGAVYVFIKTADLQAGRFDNLRGWLEC